MSPTSFNSAITVLSSFGVGSNVSEVRTDRLEANSITGNKSARHSGSPPVSASKGTRMAAISSIRWKASAVDTWARSRALRLAGRDDTAFQLHSPVISQVTCEGRSLNPALSSCELPAASAEENFPLPWADSPAGYSKSNIGPDARFGAGRQQCVPARPRVINVTNDREKACD